ncbi:MAG: hypothetical protein ACNS63_05985 [Candidatus Nitrospinota bacterium M3_3B_026]
MSAIDMKTNWRRIFTVKVLGVFAVFLAAGLMTACGKINSTDIPNKGDSTFEFYWNGSRVTPNSEQGPTLRANGRDTITVGVKVKGARSNQVDFFLPDDFATFPGCTTSDGWCSMYVDSVTGMANVIVQSKSVAGRGELIASAADTSASLLVTFDFATLTLFPSVVVLGEANTWAIIEARGGLTPIEWWVSRPEQIGIHERDETSVRVFVKDIRNPLDSGTPPEPATLYALDAEGQSAEASIYSETSGCTEATLTVSPSTGKAANAPTSVSIVLEDYDVRGQSSVTVYMTNRADNTTQAVTLSQWMVPGVFQESITLAAGPLAGDTVEFEYPDEAGSGCISDVSTATFTWS